MQAARTIFHVDMDAFFVSVEELYDPSLRSKPVVVGGRPDQRGVAAAASYEARKFGIHSAMPLRTAYKLCPHAIFVEGHPERYREYSNRVYDILLSFTPKLEMASIDEAYLDLTGTERLHGPPLRAAHNLHETVREKTKLNCSIGIATSRLVAKVASDQAKPNGILWVLPEAEQTFLAPLDVRKIPGVGKVTEQKLNALGIKTVGELAQRGEDFLHEHLGEWGSALAGKSIGKDAGGFFRADIGDDAGPKSISHEHTYGEDERSAEKLETTLAKLTEMVARRLREQQLHARTVQLKLRYADFSTITRAHTLLQATQIDSEILATIRKLFRENRKPGSAIRLLGVQVSSLEAADAAEEQLDLLQGQRQKWERALSAADQLRDKYGESAVSMASGLKGAFGERTHEAIVPGKQKPKS